jgi:hypothetical protein
MEKKRGNPVLRTAGILLLVALTSGCSLSGGKGSDAPPPGAAEISITPTTLAFTIKDPYDQSSYIGSFEVKNAGVGKLVWHVAEECDFATCDPEYGTITDEASTVTVSLDNKTVQSNMNGTLCIDSNGGEVHVALVVDVLILVSGRVLDDDTGAPLADVRISFGVDSSPNVTSDLEGYYEVWTHESDVLDGSDIIIRAGKDGYQDYYFKGKPIVRKNPPGYTQDVGMIPE